MESPSSFFAAYLSNGHGAQNIEENKWTVREIITRQVSMRQATNPWNGFEGKLSHHSAFETNRTALTLSLESGKQITHMELNMPSNAMKVKLEANIDFILT